MNEPLPETTTPGADSKEAEAPRPTFDSLPLSDEVRRALAEMAYVNPTPVQLAVWEPATRGKDAVVQARTGTGKTASFGLPIIDHILKRSVEAVQALVLTPTRELAVQVTAELDRIAKFKGTKTVAIYGGASMDRQIAALNQGAQLVVGTPGRVLDHIRRGTLKTSSIRLLVLDESDEMLSMGFERELNAILESLPAARQTLLFSATVPPDIERMAKTKLKEPEFVTLSGDHIGALEIQHFTYLIAQDKLGALIQIIESENPESAILFCNTKDQTESVAGALKSRGYDADWLNGDLPQGERESVMARTKQGQLRFLVATDVAARGIDVSHLTHVINFDFPFDAETYVHRTGRTGRAGRTGTAISLVLPQDIGSLYLLRLTYKIRPIERVVPSASELKTRAEADLVAMLAEALLPKGNHEDDRALARRLLTHDQVEGILAGLLREYLGARPNAQTEAADARRKTVRGATLRQPPREREAPRPREREIPTGLATTEGGALAGVHEPPHVATVAIAPSPHHPAPGVVAHLAPAFAAPSKPHEVAAPAAVPAASAPPPAPPTVTVTAAAEAVPAIAEPVRSGPPSPREDRGERRPLDARGGSERFGRDRDRDRDRDRFRSRDRERDPNAPAAPVAEGEAAPAERPRFTPAGAPPGAPLRSDRRDRRNDRDRPARKGPPGWQPSADEGDDEPLVAAKPRPIRSEQALVQDRIVAEPAPLAEAAAEPKSAGTSTNDDSEYAELFVGVGRRDGTRAQDILRVLLEEGGVDKDHIRRIRVRDRHAFVAIRKDQVDRVVSRLNGKPIAGKASVVVELARERSGLDDIPAEAPAGG